MCFSAIVWANYRKYVDTFGATLDIREFARLSQERQRQGRLPFPKAVVDSFLAQSTPDLGDAGKQLRQSLAQALSSEAAKLEEEIFTQRRRLADAERSLQLKLTKAASESKRIAGTKVERALARLNDLRRQDHLERDSRIFPGSFCPVMVWEDGKRVIKPMRYQCRPAGKPAIYDAKYPGTYNARRDNLEGFWKHQFGATHGVVVATAFFENVNRHRAEGRELGQGEEPENLVLRFEPGDHQPMLVACLWSKWVGSDGEELLSFAAITDEPPHEVAAAGHDRCIIPIKESNLDAWLRPDREDLKAQYAILDDRHRPFYEHKLAA